MIGWSSQCSFILVRVASASGPPQGVVVLLMPGDWKWASEGQHGMGGKHILRRVATA